ncbi:MAG: terminase family protein [Dongiaceae bacterium]
MTRLIWRPQLGPQTLAIDSALIVDELLFGGARGGGKSDFLLADFLADVACGHGGAWRGILLRRSYPELEELISRSQELYPQCFPDARYSKTSRTWRFADGATLRLRALERNEDADKYQGHAYSWIGWDELGHWAEGDAYHKLKACLRSAAGIKGLRIRASANPGGVGHHWVKRYFGIDRYPHGSVLLEEGGRTRMFLKSRVFDNHILLRQDPGYIARLQSLHAPQLVRAWLDGNWDIAAGSFFPEWDVAFHVAPNFILPDHWLRFISFDWGSSSPFSAGWWAVVGEDYYLPDQRMLSRGTLLRYREWYGADKGGEGLRLTAEEVARGIVSRTGGAENISYRVADPSIFRADGGPSIAERMAKAGVLFRPADNARLAGWDQLRARLKDHKIACFTSCTDSIRTIPALPHDRAKIEDIDTNAEDHIADEWRYACMSRPYIKPSPSSAAPITIAPLTLNSLYKASARKPKSKRI